MGAVSDLGMSAVRVARDAKTLSVHEWLPGTPEGLERGPDPNPRPAPAARGTNTLQYAIHVF